MSTETTRHETVPATMGLEEFAKSVGISRTTVYKLAREDKLPVPVIRLGRRMLVSRRAYDTLINAQHPPLVDREHSAKA